jgi:hypothetical protein
MKLKAFELYASGIGRDDSVSFHRETRCVVALYEKCFVPIRVEKAWKVGVECAAEVTSDNVVNESGVLSKQRLFDFELYFASDGPGRKRLAIEAIHGGAVDVAKLRGWPVASFDAAKAAVVAKKYMNEWTGVSRWNVARKMSAHLRCQFEPDAFRAWLVVVDRSGSVVEECLALVSIPSEFVFVPKMGKIIWVSNDRVILQDRRGAEVVCVSVGRD